MIAKFLQKLSNLAIPVFIFLSTFGLCFNTYASPTYSYDVSTNDDSIQVVKTIKGFLNWYKANYKKSNGYRLVGTDKNGYYFVDKKACEKYLQFLKSSTFISKGYIAGWRKYFDQRAQNFKENPQNEGPPEGFDYDLVTSTQEPDLLYNAVDSLKYKILEKTAKKALVQTTGEWTYNIKMSKVKGKWLIDDIEIF